MAEVTQTNEQQKKDEQFNRQINFIVIKGLWQKVIGRTKHGRRSLYEEFEMSIGRYNRLMYGMSSRITTKEAGKLAGKTGISSSIFTGEICFKFSNITKKDWEELFEKRYGDSKEYQDHLKLLLAKISDEDFDKDKNFDLYRLDVFLKVKKDNITDANSETAVNKLIKIMDELPFELLDATAPDDLKRYIDALKRQTEMAQTVLAYTNFKSNKGV